MNLEFPSLSYIVNMDTFAFTYKTMYKFFLQLYLHFVQYFGMHSHINEYHICLFTDDGNFDID